jgi:exonuclease SbcC
MRITSVVLENIKSYTRMVIDFTSGLNAVCGLNGSGKTTVLEAIGFALFDYLPYSQQAFVREGEKTGTVRVRLLAKDGREWEVVRRIGGGNPYYVADVETGTRFAERGANVLDWVRTHALGLDAKADMGALFKDAVGVPQGRMTSDFQSTAVQRKGVFDPLLRVEEYREAFDGLREAVAHVRDLMSLKREEIAGLESKTEQIPEKLEEQAVLEDQVRTCEAHLSRLAAELVDLEDQKAALDRIADALQQLKQELEGKQADVRRHTEMLALQRAALEESQRAARIVEESRPGYQLVVAARQLLTELEQQRRERDKLKDDRSAAQSDAKGIFGGIESLDKQLQQARTAAEDAARLVDDVARQTDLEEQLQEVRERLRDAEKLDEQIARVQREATELQRGHSEREVRLTEAVACRDEETRLREAPEQLQAVGEQLAQLGPLKEHAARLQTDGRALRDQHDALLAEVRQRDTFLSQIDEKKDTSAELDALLAQDQELREERARITATIEYQNVARSELARRHCPLLELECPVVAADEGMLNRFGSRLESLSGRLEQLDRERGALTEALAATRAAVTEAEQLKMRAAQLERSQSQLEDVAQRLETCRQEYREVSTVLKTEDHLKRSQTDLRERVRRLQDAQSIAARLALLEEQQARDQSRLETVSQELEQLKERRAAFQGTDQAAQSLQEQLQEQNDPRRKQQDLLALAGRATELEASVAAEQEHLVEAQARVKALTGRLEAFASLDEHYEEQCRIEQANSVDYERFLANRDEAGQLEERGRIVAEATETLEEAQRDEEKLGTVYEETCGRYDADRHGRLEEQCEMLGREVATESENQKHLSKALQRVEEDLAYLRRQQEKLSTCRTELEELERVARAVGFIRDTIKAAGPAITETLLTNISQMANDVYAELMDDHAAELRWDRDYEVLVQRGAETRKFAQLSGGEQMSAALAVRLALLKEMSEVDFAFFDEPTQNMDGDRRTNLADQIRAVRGFEQLIVISHDDTFEHHTDNLIRLRKVHEETELEAG